MSIAIQIRALLALLAFASLVACARDPLPGEGADLGLPPSPDLKGGGVLDLSVPGPRDLAGSFCGDPVSPHAELNGMFATFPAVSATELFLNCCEAAVVEVVSMQLSEKLSVSWFHQVGQGPSPPVKLDLANLPPGWRVMLQSGCSPNDVNCQATDRYDSGPGSGLSGTLTVTGGNGGHEMSLCLTALQSGNPHPVIHSLRLWVPTVKTQ